MAAQACCWRQTTTGIQCNAPTSRGWCHTSSAAALVFPLLETHSTTAEKATLPFNPVRAPLPLPNDGLGAAEQRRVYQTFGFEVKLLVPEGYRAELIAVWGDRYPVAP